MDSKLLKGITHINNAAIRIEGRRTIYIDPYKIEGKPQDADIIFCTHDHKDHLSKKDIKKVMKPETILVLPQSKALKYRKWVEKEMLFEVIGVVPNETYKAYDISFQTFPAYNINKKYHPRSDNGVGFNLTIKEHRYYFAGDTCYVPELDQLETDVVFVPVGGKYTMGPQEAARAVNAIKPKVAVPYHFGSVAGTRGDAEDFVAALDKKIDGCILLEE